VLIIFCKVGVVQILYQRPKYNVTVYDFAVSGHLVAIDEEDGVGSFGNASTNAICESTEFVCKRSSPDFCGVAGNLAGDKVTVFVALASGLVDDGISSVLSWEALDWGIQDRLI
jgi:hypothetical protein